MQADGLDEIQRRLGYRFRRSSLLIEALTNKSYLNEAKETGDLDNERLEFLGDAVLDLIVSEYLLSAFPDAAEGELSKLRARLVSEKTLARVAGRIGLGELLRLGRGETKTQGHNKPSILADALEAVFAGVYLDGGLDAAAASVKAAFSEELASCDRSLLTRGEFKTKICEMEIKFFPDLAPKHVENFITLAKSGFYDKTLFHRVIPGFMIQGGDPNTKDPNKKSEYGMGGPSQKLKAEFNAKPHTRGIVSMARSNNPDSAGSQFFIVVKDSPFLDRQYTVFGEVIRGMDVADKIVNSPRGQNDLPNERIEMTVTIVDKPVQ